MKEGKALRALRQLTWTAAGQSSAGRNSAGRITIFHRGGGSKRLQRRVDLKRSTSSIGIVERIEYDPNRSSRIALVRWVDGVQPQLHRQSAIQEFAPPRNTLEPTPVIVRGIFSFSSLLGNVDQRKTTSVKDVFLSAFSSPKAKGKTAASLSVGGSCGLPRIAVAGAKPAFFAPRMREEVGEKNTLSPCEVRKWNPHSTVWEHRIKRKAALSWQSFNTLGLVGAAKHNEMKPKMDQGSSPAKPKDGACKVDRAPVSYVIASHSLKPGKMVMNCDWSKPPTSNMLQSAQYAYPY